MKRLIPALAAVFLLCGSALAATRVEHQFEKSVSAEGIRRILVETKPSEITIRNGDATKITVKGTVSRNVRNRKDVATVQQIVNDIEMEIETVASRATIRPRFGARSGSFRQRRVETSYKIEITVPRGTHVEVRQSVGEVDVAGDFGDVDVAMRVGEIRLDLVKASVRELHARTRIGEVRTNYGDRIITNEGILPGAADYENPEGQYLVRANVHIGEIDIKLRPPS